MAKRLPAAVAAADVLAEVEKALEIPVELVEPVLAQRAPAPRQAPGRAVGQTGGEDRATGQHGEAPNSGKADSPCLA